MRAVWLESGDKRGTHPHSTKVAWYSITHATWFYWYYIQHHQAEACRFVTSYQIRRSRGSCQCKMATRRDSRSFVTVTRMTGAFDTTTTVATECTVGFYCLSADTDTVPIEDLVSALLLCAERGYRRAEGDPSLWRVWVKYILMALSLEKCRGETFFIGDLEFLARHLSRYLHGYTGIPIEVPDHVPSIPWWSWPSSRWLLTEHIEPSQYGGVQFPGGDIALVAAGYVRQPPNEEETARLRQQARMDLLNVIDHDLTPPVSPLSAEEEEDFNAVVINEQ